MTGLTSAHQALFPTLGSVWGSGHSLLSCLGSSWTHRSQTYLPFGKGVYSGHAQERRGACGTLGSSNKVPSILGWLSGRDQIRTLLSEAPPTKPAMAVHCLSISMSALVGSPTCTHGFKYSFPSLLLSLQDIVVNPYYTELLCLACRVVSECVQGPCLLLW